MDTRLDLMLDDELVEYAHYILDQITKVEEDSFTLLQDLRNLLVDIHVELYKRRIKGHTAFDSMSISELNGFIYDMKQNITKIPVTWNIVSTEMKRAVALAEEELEKRSTKEA